MDAVKELITLDLRYIFVGIIVILVSVKFLWLLLEWFVVKKLGLETRKQRQRKEDREQLEKTTELAKQTARNLAKLEAQYTKDEKDFREDLNRHMTESEKDRKSLHQEMKRYSDNRIKDREQSIHIQREITSSVDKLTKMFSSFL